jgi:hypothetical protein
MDVAGRRARAAAVFGRVRSLCGRAAPRHRHRRRGRTRRGCAGRRHGLLRRLCPGRRPLGHDHHRRWVCRDVAPARGDDRPPRQHRRGGSRGRRRRRERRRRHAAATRPPRHSRRLRPEWICRPARPAARTSDRTAAAARSGAAGGRTGSSDHRRDAVAPACTSGSPERPARRSAAAARAGGRVGCRASGGRAAHCRQAHRCQASGCQALGCQAHGCEADRRATAAMGCLGSAPASGHAHETGGPFVAAAARACEARTSERPERHNDAARKAAAPTRRHAEADRAEGECGIRSAHAGCRHSTRRGTPAGDHRPTGRAAAKAQSGVLDARAHRSGARRRGRLADPAQACAYHGWR